MLQMEYLCPRNKFSICNILAFLREAEFRFATLLQVRVSAFLSAARIVQWNSKQEGFDLLHAQKRQTFTLHLQQSCKTHKVANRGMVSDQNALSCKLGFYFSNAEIPLATLLKTFALCNFDTISWMR